MFAAVLDTCALWPSLQRDALLSFAVEGLYRPLWSSAILAELEEHERRKLIERGATDEAATARASRLVEQMRQHFDDACVEGWEDLDGTFGLPDRDDEHVVAAAMIGGAGAIVTNTLRHLRIGRRPAGHPGTDSSRVRGQHCRRRPGPSTRRARSHRRAGAPTTYDGCSHPHHAR